jgi:hypothetical protein
MVKPIQGRSPWQPELDDERRTAADDLLAELNLPFEAQQPALLAAREIATAYDRAVVGPDTSLGSSEARRQIADLLRSSETFREAARAIQLSRTWAYGGTATNELTAGADAKQAARITDPLAGQIGQAETIVSDLVPELRRRLRNADWPEGGRLTFDNMTIGTAQQEFVRRCHADLWHLIYPDILPGGNVGPFARIVRSVFCMTEAHRLAPDQTFARPVRELVERLKSKTK